MGILEFISDFGAALLLCAGAFLTLRFRFFQITKIKAWAFETLKSIRKEDRKKAASEGAVSAGSVLCSALGKAVGVGNIAGVASALTIGGAGAIFWMWVAAFLGMITSYCENALGAYYRQKNEHGEMVGGATHYLRHGVGGRIGAVLAVVFSIGCVVASFGIGGAAQIKAAVDNLGVSGSKRLSLLLGALFAVFAFAAAGKMKKAAVLGEKIVPVMVLLYCLCTAAIIALNIKRLSFAFRAIFRNAFGSRALAGGTAGASLRVTLRTGVNRGVFSNEAGMGSSTLLSGSSCSPAAEQGFIGVLEVFIDTIVMCSLTALAALTSPLFNPESGRFSVFSGGALIKSVFLGSLGPFGGIFLSLSVALFAFSTVIAWSAVGARAWEFLFGCESLYIYRFLFLGSLVPAALAKSDSVWLFCDSANALMIIPNLLGVLILTPTVKELTRQYFLSQKALNKNLVNRKKL